MINRVLIRVKVVQVLYSYLLTRPDRTFDQALADLEASFDRSYDFYVSMFRLMIDLTDLQAERLEEAKHKFVPSEADLHPDTRFVDNALVATLRENGELNRLFADRDIRWDDPIFLRLMLDKVLRSDDYAAYMSQPDTSLDADVEVWRQLFKNVILDDEDFIDYIENRSIFVGTEDIDIMGQFVIKSLRRLAQGDPEAITPKFRDQDDSTFGKQLFEKTVRDYEDNNLLIDGCIHSERWDRTRVALLDRVIMNVAVTELRHFGDIPPQVTLNEYINLAKVFCSENSGSFVNGVLNNVMHNLFDRGKIDKIY